MDTVDATTRSRMMAGIGRRDTAPELRVRRFLHGAGLRFSLHRRDLPGRPDVVLPRYRTIVFIHGCFWHRHQGCPFSTTPGTRVDFWTTKFEANMARDQRNDALLSARGWQVLTVWECQTDEESLSDLFWRIVSNPS